MSGLKIMRFGLVDEVNFMTLDDYLKLPYTFILNLTPDEDGDIVAYVKELCGCSSHGVNEQEALNNLTEAMTLWIADALEKGHEIPIP